MYDDFLVEGNNLTQRIVSESSCEISGEGSACYGFWKNGTANGTSILKPFILKGCWSSHQDCFNKTECIANYFGNDHYFCCCDSPKCNIRMTLTSEPSKTSTSGKSPMLKMTGDIYNGAQSSAGLRVIMVALLPIIVLAVVVVAIFFSWRVCRGRIRGDSSSSSASIESKEAPLLPPRVSPTPSIDAETILKHIRLLEIVAVRHSGGCVRKAKLENEMQVDVVAVKIFTSQEKLLWEKERDIYTSTGLRCNNPNVPRYVGALKHETISKTEYWLITEYQELGCLYDFLKTHTVSWTEAIHIVLSACEGLAFIHSSSDAKLNFLNLEGKKLPIAHRDVKSRNVLLRGDRTSCIADFGLALVLDGKAGNAHSQVGTLRYMSPEVLDGSIHISAESFLKIDSYAFALVVWEVLTRTYANGVDAALEYKLPFEEEVGLSVSLEDMKQAVVDEHMRPQIKQQWREHEGMSIMVAAMEEMWDHDPDGRLSVSTACHRLFHLRGNERDHPVHKNPSPLEVERNLALVSSCINSLPGVGCMEAFSVSENVQSPKNADSRGGNMQDSMTCVSIDTDDDYLVPPLNLKATKHFNYGSTPQVMNGYIVNNTAEKMFLTQFGQEGNKITPYDNRYPPNVTPFGISNNEKYQPLQHMDFALNQEIMPLTGSPYALAEGFSPSKSDYTELIVSSSEKSNCVASPRV